MANGKILYAVYLTVFWLTWIIGRYKAVGGHSRLQLLQGGYGRRWPSGIQALLSFFCNKWQLRTVLLHTVADDNLELVGMNVFSPHEDKGRMLSIYPIPNWWTGEDKLRPVGQFRVSFEIFKLNVWCFQKKDWEPSTSFEIRAAD